MAPERAALELAAVDGEQRDAADEGGADVGAAAGREEPGVGADVLIDPVEALGGEGGAGRAERAQPREVAPVRRLGPLLHAGGYVAGAGAEAGRPRALGKVPEDIHVRVARVAVVGDDRRAGEEDADEEVPHHPAGRREPEDAVAFLGVHVEVQLLQVLEQDAPVPLDDRLRQAGGPRGVEDPERVVERHLLEGEFGTCARIAQFVPADRVLEPAEVGLRVHVGEDHRVLEGRHLALEPRDNVEPVEVAAAVAVAVDREEDLRLDLREAVDDARGAEVGRAARPDRADRGGGREGDDRLRDVRHVGDDAVAAAHAEAAEARRDGRDLLAQLAPGDLLHLGAHLGGAEDRHLAGIAVAEQVLGKVQLAAGEPLRARHRAVGEDLVVRLRCLNFEVVPDRGPEVLELVHRPAPELVVVRELSPALGREPAHVAGHLRSLDRLRRRLPELLAAVH